MNDRIEIAREFAKAINDEHIIRIILFGSVAREEDTEDSDIDIILTRLNDIFGDDLDIAKELNGLLGYGYSLSEAIPELIKKGYTQEEIDDFFTNTEEGKYIQSLTEDEIDALVYYCGNGYETINEFMRNATEEEVNSDYYVSNIRSALAKFVLKDMNLLLYKGDSILFASSDPVLSKMLEGIEEDDVENINSALQSAIGLTFTTNSFYSTSPAYWASFAPNSDVVLEIIAPEGTNGAYVNTLGNYNTENEFLLADGLELQILNSYIGMDGAVHVQLFVLSDSSSTEEVETSITSDDSITDSHISDYGDIGMEGHNFTATMVTPMSDLTLDLLDRIDEVVDKVNNGDASESAIYYELLNILGEFVESDEKVPVDDIISLLNHCKELRTAIVHAAKEEISTMLSSMYGINDDAFVDQLVDCLTGGEQFIEGTVGTGMNWEGFINAMESLFKEKVSQEIASGKEPVFWSKFADEYHEGMNDKFTTIEGTTIGGYLYFLDVLYSNWKGEGSPKLEDLWGMLSSVYAEGVLSATNPETGTYYDNITFLYPDSVNCDDCFGDLFIKVEFPAILRSGNIKTITLTKTNPETMETSDTIEIDISGISEYYIANLNKNGESNASLDEDVFEMLINKITMMEG